MESGAEVFKIHVFKLERWRKINNKWKYCIMFH